MTVTLILYLIPSLTEAVSIFSLHEQMKLYIATPILQFCDWISLAS